MGKNNFRGLLADGGQEQINLHTNDGKTGYQIKKMQLIGGTPGNEIVEAVVKIYSGKQTTIDGAVDLSDNTLIAVGFYVSSTTEEWSVHNIMIFDNEIINQDIIQFHNYSSIRIKYGKRRRIFFITGCIYYKRIIAI